MINLVVLNVRTLGKLIFKLIIIILILIMGIKLVRIIYEFGKNKNIMDFAINSEKMLSYNLSIFRKF